ncbi:mucin-5AC-like [Daphnia carinata]|uniref:mucin-5AC-like n=1 Tax=Daphnia carinata TaxID=120202 RepID=UPI00257C3200|nr:mucin-5AC-like [Daphnia carinata]
MQFVVLAALIAVAAANSEYLGQTSSNSASNFRSYSPSTYEVKEYPTQPYSFNWAVYDGYGNDYAHSESSDSKVTTGSYRVLLPDGRVQIVTYKDDGYGYIADVKYEGEAKYPAPSAYSTQAYSAPVFTPQVVTAPAVSSRTYSAPVVTAPAGPARVLTTSSVIAPGVNSRTYSAPVFVSSAGRTLGANSRTYSGPVLTSSSVTAPGASSRTYSSPVFTSPASSSTVFTSSSVSGPAAVSRTYSAPVFTSDDSAFGRVSQIGTGPATGSVYMTSGNVARDY